jgi:hypothetical protein
MQKAEGRRQKTEGRRQKTEDRRQKAEDRRQKTEGRKGIASHTGVPDLAILRVISAAGSSFLRQHKSILSAVKAKFKKILNSTEFIIA